jgi:hypothetical protein
MQRYNIQFQDDFFIHASSSGTSVPSGRNIRELRWMPPCEIGGFYIDLEKRIAINPSDSFQVHLEIIETGEFEKFPEKLSPPENLKKISSNELSELLQHHFNWLEDTKNKRISQYKCVDLSGYDLSGHVLSCDLSYINFIYSDLSNADIRDAKFANADLRHAKFCNVNANKATNFYKCRLEYSSLIFSGENAPSSICDCWFYKAFVSGNWSNCYLYGSNFSFSECTKLNFTGIRLSEETTFSNAVISDCDFSHAICEGANFLT